MHLIFTRTEHCHSPGFCSQQTSLSLPFLRQGNPDIVSFNHLQIFTKGLMCAQDRQPHPRTNSVAAAEFHKSSQCLLGAGSSQKTVWHFPRVPQQPPALPRSDAGGEIQMEAGHTSLASFILLGTRSFYSLHRYSQKCHFSDYHLSPTTFGQLVTKTYRGFIWGDIKHFGDNFRCPEFLP